MMNFKLIDNTFFCTAGRGTEQFVHEEIKSKLDSDVIRVSDGKVFFKILNACSPQKIFNLKSVERIFIEICSFKSTRLPYGKGKGQFLNSLTRRLVKKEKFVKSLEILQKFQQQRQKDDTAYSLEPNKKKLKVEINPENRDNRYFSVVTFRASCKISGQFSTLISSQELNIELGKHISKVTGWKVDLSNYDIEVTVRVNDQMVIAGVPVIQQPLSRRSYILHHGLRSTIAWIIADLAKIQVGDVVLDPMCGKATILIEAATSCQKDAIYIGCDKNREQIKLAEKNKHHAGLNKSLHFIEGNGLDLPFKEEVIDRIICDAPFGHNHTTDINIHEFYNRLILEFNRVLKPGGRVVLLTGSNLREFVLQLLNTNQNRDMFCDDLCQPAFINKKQHIAETKEEERTNQSSELATTSTNQTESIGEQSSGKTVICEQSHNASRNRIESESSVPVINKQCLSLVVDHYVKLGDTHAYIVVADKC